MHPKIKAVYDSANIFDIWFNGSKDLNKRVASIEQQLINEYEENEKNFLKLEIRYSLLGYLIKYQILEITLSYDDFKEMLSSVNTFNFFTPIFAGVKCTVDEVEYKIRLGKDAVNLDWR